MIAGPNEKAPPATGSANNSSHEKSNGNGAGLQADISNETTLGLEIFRSRHISNIRNQLERKALTCVLIGGSRHDHLPIPIQIDNQLLRHVYYLARITKEPKDLLSLDGETGDIARHCYRDGIPPILTKSPTPIFGEDDLHLLGLIDQIEALEEKAMKGEILL